MLHSALAKTGKTIGKNPKRSTEININPKIHFEFGLVSSCFI
jgi:hypothetical protein